MAISRSAVCPRPVLWRFVESHGGLRSAARELGADLRFTVNAIPCDPESEPAGWPQGWTQCEISLRKGNIAWGSDQLYDERTLKEWVCRFVGLVVSLLPLEPINEGPLGVAEGGHRHTLVKRYERSRLNRAACIEVQGVRCVVCDFSFGEAYGPIGEGFIHVHHIESVSTLLPGTVLDPSRDLVPVCPNCHAMLHTSRPPMSPAQLRARLRPPAQSL
jgi:5-methylcytosine-specific restriction protein A